MYLSFPRTQTQSDLCVYLLLSRTQRYNKSRTYRQNESCLVYLSFSRTHRHIPPISFPHWISLYDFQPLQILIPWLGRPGTFTFSWWFLTLELWVLRKRGVSPFALSSMEEGCLILCTAFSEIFWCKRLHGSQINTKLFNVLNLWDNSQRVWGASVSSAP